MSANVAEAWLVGLSIFSVLVVGYHLFHWRSDKVHWVIFVAAVGAMWLGARLWSLDEIEFLAVLFLLVAAGGAVAYSALRSGIFKCGPGLAVVGASLGVILLPAVLRAVCFSRPRAILAVSVLIIPVTAVLGLPVGLVLSLLSGAFQKMSVPGTVPGPRPQDRAQVLDMLADGTISSEDAAELLSALGEQKVPADRLPLNAGLLAGFWGGLIVAVGFILPWGHVRMGPIQGYQAGYHIGLLGWIILVLGTMPALLACIPALDRGLRQGLLRLLLSGVGLAFALSLGGMTLSRGHLPGVGLWVVSLGFALQIAGGFGQSGLLQTDSASAEELPSA